MAPPTRRVTHIFPSSGIIPYNLIAQPGISTQDKPIGTATKRLIKKRCLSFIAIYFSYLEDLWYASSIAIQQMEFNVQKATPSIL